MNEWINQHYFILLCSTITFCMFWVQDPSSPRSVQSYSSRENGLDKMPPSRKEGPPQASPTSLASSSSAASPSRGKEPPQVHRHICMNSCAVPWTTQWHKKQNIWMVIADIYDEQCRTSVLLGCQHMLYSAVMLGSIVHLGVIMLCIQHPTHWGLAADIPQHCSGPICPQSYFHSLLFCVLLFAILLPWLASSFTVKLFFFPHSSLYLKAACFFLLFFFTVHSRFSLFSFATLFSNASLVFQREKSSTPGMKPGTPMSQESNTPGPSGPPQFRPVPGKPGVDLGKNVLCACFYSWQNTSSVPLLLKGSLKMVWSETISMLFRRKTNVFLPPLRESNFHWTQVQLKNMSPPLRNMHL